MNKAERYEMIFSQFDKSSKEFCDEICALNCNVTPTYKGDEKPENLDSIIAEIYGKSYIILFRYSAHSILEYQHSVLDCLIRFGKADAELSIPLPFVYDFCDENITEPLCIPCIFNKQGMKEAFSVLGEAVKRLLHRISSISCDEVQKQEIQRYYSEEYSLFMGSSEIDTKSDELFLRFLVGRFSSSAYILAFKGKTEKAVKELQKPPKKFRCEKRLLSLWQAGKFMNCEKIPSIISNMEWVNDRGETGIDGKELLPIFLSWLVLAIPASAVYLGLYFLLILIQQHDSILLTGVMWNIPYCIFAGFLTAIAISYFTRLWFVRLLYRKNYEKLAEQDQINSSRGADKVMRFFTRLVIVGSIVFTVFIATWNLNFKSDGFVDNTGFFSIRGEYHDYDEVESVSYIPNRVNGYGETLERPSYKLVLKNGKEIDLYEYADISDYDPDLIDFLKSKGVKVVQGEKED